MQPAAALDLLPDGALVADGDGVVVACNPVAASMLGTDPSTAQGRALEDVLALADHEGLSWCSAHRPYAGLAARTAVPEQTWLLPDGSEVLVTARLHRSRPRGPVTSVALVLRSGRGRARLDRDRSDLVATVAHELRSPLTGVKGFVTALLNRWDKLSDDQKRLMLTTVAADADRLSRLITELLDVARIDTGRLQLHRQSTDLAQLAERVVASFDVASSRRFELSIAERPQIDADPDKVIQVLTNLVENAVKHGSGTVRVRVASGVDGATVEVGDEGTGIPAELRRRVFTKFWTGARGGGSGLGLYIVHGLVLAHGGTVEIGDAREGGACVTVRWPVDVPATAEESR